MTVGTRNAADEATVRAYLRAAAGWPVRRDHPTAVLESAFVHVVARWAERAGVDRQTLVDVGVAPGVLDRAGMVQPSTREWLRRYWDPSPFTIDDLVRRSGLSTARVRRAVAQDEDGGLLRCTGMSGPKLLYEVAA